MTPTHRTTAELRWRDLDMLGHLNQSVYHELLEEGRGALVFDALGTLESDGWTFVVARVELDYVAEVRKDHSPVHIDCSVGRVGNSSFTIEHSISRSDGTVAARGSSVLVAWDAHARTSRPLSDEERAKLQGTSA